MKSITGNKWIRNGLVFLLSASIATNVSAGKGIDLFGLKSRNEEISRDVNIRTITIDWENEDYVTDVLMSRDGAIFESDLGKVLITYTMDDYEGMDQISEYYNGKDTILSKIIDLFNRDEDNFDNGLLIMQRHQYGKISHSGSDVNKYKDLIKDSNIEIGFICDASISRSIYEYYLEQSQNGDWKHPELGYDIDDNVLDSMYIDEGKIIQAGRYETVLPDLTDQNSRKALENMILDTLRLQEEIGIDPMIVFSNIHYGLNTEHEIKKETGVGTEFSGLNPYDGEMQRQMALDTILHSYGLAVEEGIISNISDVKTIIMGPHPGQIKDFDSNGINVYSVIFNNLVTRERIEMGVEQSSVNYYDGEYSAMIDMVSEAINNGTYKLIIVQTMPDGYDLDDLTAVRNLGISRIMPLLHEYEANTDKSEIEISYFMGFNPYDVPGIKDQTYISFLEGSVFPTLDDADQGIAMSGINE